MVLGYLLLTIFFSFFPGYLFYLNFFKLENSEETIFPVSFGISLIFISCCQFVSFLFSPNLCMSNTLLYVFVISTLSLRIRIKNIQIVRSIPSVFYAFVFFNLYCCFLLYLTPSYQTAYSADWGLYYPNIFLYLDQVGVEHFQKGLRMEYLVRRTPNFSLINAFFLSFYGNTYYYYQMISTFLGSLIFWNVYLFTERFYGKKVAFFALLLLPIMPIFVRRICTPTPKAFATFYFFLALFFYGQLRLKLDGNKSYKDLFLFSLFGLGAFMAHPSMLFYLIWLLVDGFYLWQFKKKKLWKFGEWVWIFGLQGAILVLPWFFWAINGMGLKNVLTPTYTISEVHLSFFEYLVSRVKMVLTTLLFPLPLLSTFKEVFFRIGGWCDFIERSGNSILRFYWETFLGGFTISGFLFLFGERFKVRKKIDVPENQ